jgi:phosphatidylserine/phosphatidylglycerophosphate/cardiolipin synthase-like enzyme
MGPGEMVTVRGIVLNGPELGTARFIQDGTSGLSIADPAVLSYGRGDEIAVTGLLDEFNQLLTLTEVADHDLISRGNPMPAEIILTPGTLSEANESMLVRINGGSFLEAGQTFMGNGWYHFMKSADTATLRVHASSDLAGQVIPGGTVHLSGILGQMHMSDPCKGYYILPRGQEDIQPCREPGITYGPVVSGLSQQGFSLEWNTAYPGTSGVCYGHTPALELGKTTLDDLATVHRITLSGFSPSSLVFVRAFSVCGTDTSFAPSGVVMTASISTGGIDVYFTSSMNGAAGPAGATLWLDDTADDTLAAFIGRAGHSIDAAIYNIGKEGVCDLASAFNAAFERGVRIRIIVDGSTANEGLEGLDPGIPVVFSPAYRDEGIMHNKFMIIDALSADADDDLVWTGSMNWTGANINRDANNIIIIRDRSLALGYTREFEEMWGGEGAYPDPARARFGAQKTDNTPHEYLIGGIPVFCYFSPSDGVNGKLLESIGSAEQEIGVNTMLITRDDVTMALSDKAASGVAARVVVNDEEDCTPSVSGTLKSSLGSRFREYGEEGVLHSKALIVDPQSPGSDPLVLAGSHNWSVGAETKNDENTLIIHDATIAGCFRQEFMERYEQATPLHISGLPAPGGLSVWPLPASGILYLSGADPTTTLGVFRIYDVAGRALLASLADHVAGNVVAISVEGLKPGIYILEYVNGNRATRVRIILK